MPRLACGNDQLLTYDCGSTVLDTMLESTEIAEQTDWKAEHLSQVAYISENLKC